VRLLWIVTTVAIVVAVGACGGSPSAPEDVKSLIVVGTPPSVGASTQFTALAVHSDGTTAPLTAHVAWFSSNTAVATVKDDGTVTGVSLGSVEISAATGGTRGALTFEVISGLTFRLSGTVTDGAAFRRMPGVTVVAKDASGASISVVTDSNGSYAIGGIAAGPADINARADGYIPTRVPAQIGGDTTVNITMGRPTLCPSLGFDDLALERNGVPFTSWSGCDFTVTATTSIWNVVTTNGRPAPFVQFTSPLGVTTSAELAVTAASGAAFRFQSIDVFAATTTVGYSITGIGKGVAAFVLQNTVGSQFGTGFTTVRNADSAGVPIDALVIRLTNPGATCCVNAVNGMGLDNIVLAR
jgi:hypothetical protein